MSTRTVARRYGLFHGDLTAHILRHGGTAEEAAQQITQQNAVARAFWDRLKREHAVKYLGAQRALEVAG